MSIQLTSGLSFSGCLTSIRYLSLFHPHVLTVTVLIRLHRTHPRATPQARLWLLQLLSMQASKMKSPVDHPPARTVVAHYRKLAVLSVREDGQMLF